MSGGKMKNSEIKLTGVDRLILKSYSSMLDGLSKYLGTGYEMVLHSLEDFSHSAIKVINGYHTGRQEGAPITDLALKMLEELQNNRSAMEVIYFSKNKQGEPLKSATIAIRGEHDRIIGLLCINFYLNTPLQEFMQEMFVGNVHTDSDNNEETYSSNSKELVEETLNTIKKEVYNDASVSVAKKNKEIVKRAYEKGIYNLKDSVQITANILMMSKNTVYMHLRNLEK